MQLVLLLYTYIPQIIDKFMCPFNCDNDCQTQVYLEHYNNSLRGVFRQVILRYMDKYNVPL